MELPKGIEIEGLDPGDWVFEVHKNVYGQKLASRTWFLFLKDKLVNELNFKQSAFDECLFYRGNVMYVLYTDDSILAGPDEAELKAIVQEIKDAKLDNTVEGKIEDFLGVNIQEKGDKFHLTQPNLIKSIIKDLGLEERQDGSPVNTKDTPMASSKFLGKLIFGMLPQNVSDSIGLFDFSRCLFRRCFDRCGGF